MYTRVFDIGRPIGTVLFVVTVVMGQYDVKVVVSVGP
jgi:hypothetical protein